MLLLHFRVHIAAKQLILRDLDIAKMELVSMVRARARQPTQPYLDIVKQMQHALAPVALAAAAGNVKRIIPVNLDFVPLIRHVLVMVRVREQIQMQQAIAKMELVVEMGNVKQTLLEHLDIVETAQYVIILLRLIVLQVTNAPDMYSQQMVLNM
jgi:hypothetical protein